MHGEYHGPMEVGDRNALFSEETDDRHCADVLQVSQMQALISFWNLFRKQMTATACS